MSGRILAVKIRSSNKRKLILVNMYAPHSGLSTQEYEIFLEKLQEKVMKKVNKRRLIVIGGDWKAQAKKTWIDATTKYGLSSKSNRNENMLEEFMFQNTMDIVNHRHQTRKKGPRRHATFKPWNKQIRSSELDSFVSNKPTAITSFKVDRKISKDTWQHELKNHMGIQISINLTPHNTKPKYNTEKDVSTYLKACSKPFHEALQRKLQNTEFETEEVEYLQLAKAIREVVEELSPSKKRNGFHRKNCAAALEVIKLKPQRWNTASSEEKARMSREVMNTAFADRSVYLDKICTSLETNFNANNSNRDFRIL
eukprot:augustus_masked-scaffold_6-processed-gene-14.52-mRNA-1 protein AED:1.00 eAED:1.00 QI:0/-1/0/0/-1/1/1/0/310